MKSIRKTRDGDSWNFDDWRRLNDQTRSRVLQASSDDAAWRLISKQARRVMRAYTTSFFIVSRFLPPKKRAQVEVIYAAVRYPDEIVDTFALPPSQKRGLLDRWQRSYETATQCETIEEAIDRDVPCFLAAFTSVLREQSIPLEYYRSFLDAMRRDITPSPFASLDDLIKDYIYGSAVVVGYFLTYVYGSTTAADFSRALASARSLGIALQLTNFLRDVNEDQIRGRVYLPQDVLNEAGLADFDVNNAYQQPALSMVLRRMAGVASDYYALAHRDLDAFNPDCRLAVQACIRVYGRLNERISRNTGDAPVRRESVPLTEKFQVLPPSKYWRIPLAYLMR